MQIRKVDKSDTETELSIVASTAELVSLKDHVLGHFQARVKVAGFREGKAPLNLVEKQVDPGALQTEFLEEAISQLYSQAIQAEKLRPVDRPQVTLTKFVPFSALEFKATVPVISEIKLPNYKQFKKSKPTVTVTAEDVKAVLSSLQKQTADKKDVDRPAKDGDQVWIDFKGVDAKGQPIKGADGKDYPLLLGSQTFIPGFEENLVGVKADEEKTFDLTFPKDYGVKALAGQKVSFTVYVTKVQEVVPPKLDDVFAAKVSPFKTLTELKADIKKQLQHERSHEASRAMESELVRDITAKSKLTVPSVLIDDQVERLVQELRQNLSYRGQTYQEFLEAEDKTDEQYRKDLAPQAEERVKASLVLAEIAEQEKLEVTPEELEVRLQVLKGQYKDSAMQAELDKPENRRDIAARLLTEKTVARLVNYATG